MEDVQTQHRLRGALAHDVVDPLRAVRGNVAELGGSCLAEQVEEPGRRGGVAALARPHQPAGVVIDHTQQVTLPLAVADLVDPDPAQALQPVGAPGHAAVSSKTVVNRDPCRAHGTATTITPCSGQPTRGASASR